MYARKSDIATNWIVSCLNERALKRIRSYSSERCILENRYSNKSYHKAGLQKKRLCFQTTFSNDRTDRKNRLPYVNTDRSWKNLWIVHSNLQHTNHHRPPHDEVFARLKKINTISITSNLLRMVTATTKQNYVNMQLFRRSSSIETFNLGVHAFRKVSPAHIDTNVQM